MYLIVIALLSLVLAFPRPPYRLVTEPAWVLLAVSLATLLPAVVAHFASRKALRLFDEDPSNPGDGQYVLGRGVYVAQIVLALAHAAVLVGTDWILLCAQTPLVGKWPVVPSLIAVTPFLISIILVWLALYPADRAIREIAVEAYLLRGKPVRPVWSVGRYLEFNLRHQVLFVLVPMLLILAARDFISAHEDDLRRASGHVFFADILLGLAAGVVALIAPEILRHVWVTQRLPNGPLRDSLLSLCRKLRMRCREILVWRSGGMIVNAAVMGVISPVRYVLITDGMLEQMDDMKIEAVFGHEAGHVKRHHVLFLLLFAFISGCLLTIVSIRTQRLDKQSVQVAMAVLGLVLLFKWGILFGWISRRFERQADVFGVRTLALGGVPCVMPCALHQGATPGSSFLRKRDPLCATAAHLFGDTLNEVAILNGIPPEARSWRHSSISSRSRFLQRLAGSPDAAFQFERRVFWIKVALMIAAIVTGAWAAVELRLWSALRAFF